MARIFLSPLIVDVRGKQSDTVFSKWKGINYIRSRVVPSNPKSAAQVAIREALARLVSLWQDAMSSVQVNNNYYMTGKNASGFNNFIGGNTVDEEAGNELQICEDNGYTEITVWTAATGSGSGEIDVTFAPTPVPTGDKLVYLLRKADTSVWDVKDEWAAAVASPQTISGLDAGDTYQVYGFLKKISPGDGSEIGESQSDSAAAQT